MLGKLVRCLFCLIFSIFIFKKKKKKTEIKAYSWKDSPPSGSWTLTSLLCPRHICFWFRPLELKKNG